MGVGGGKREERGEGKLWLICKINGKNVKKIKFKKTESWRLVLEMRERGDR